MEKIEQQCRGTTRAPHEVLPGAILRCRSLFCGHPTSAVTDRLNRLSVVKIRSREQHTIQHDKNYMEKQPALSAWPDLSRIENSFSHSCRERKKNTKIEEFCTVFLTQRMYQWNLEKCFLKENKEFSATEMEWLSPLPPEHDAVIRVYGYS